MSIRGFIGFKNSVPVVRCSRAGFSAETGNPDKMAFTSEAFSLKTFMRGIVATTQEQTVLYYGKTFQTIPMLVCNYSVTIGEQANLNIAYPYSIFAIVTKSYVVFYLNTETGGATFRFHYLILEGL